MSRLNDQNARQLLKLFLDGETSIAQEKQLYDYFSRRDLPADMEDYREMMSWYASLSVDKKVSRIRPLQRFGFKWISVAAAVVLLLAVGLPLYRDYEIRQNLYAAYEGSYIIRDGVKIDNIPAIIDQLLEAEDFASSLTETSAVTTDAIIDELCGSIPDAQTRMLVLNQLKQQ